MLNNSLTEIRNQKNKVIINRPPDKGEDRR